MSKITVFVPSFGRADTISTHKFFTDENLWDLKIVVHTENCKKEYEEKNSELIGKIIVSNVPKGLINQRDWIYKQLQENEWIFFCDDDIKHFYKHRDEFYILDNIPAGYAKDLFFQKELRQSYKTKATQKELYNIFTEMKNKCEQLHFKLFGFATVDNPFFNLNKYVYCAYIKGGCFGIQKSKQWNFTIDAEIENAEDFAMTASQCLTFGGVLRNNFCYSDAKHYIKGGLGKYEEREQKKIIANTKLVKKYDGFFSFNAKAGKHPHAELKINFKNTEQVKKWRIKMKNKITQK